MSLDPMPSAAELLRMKREREARRTGRQHAPPCAQAPARPTIAWPVMLRIPWSRLCSDNERHGVINGRLLLTTKYRQSKAAIAALAREQLGDVEPVAIPLAFTGRVWLPDHRLHDPCNFGKSTQDALAGVVYVDDRWLWRVVWERAGVDVDAPRAELSISPCMG